MTFDRMESGTKLYLKILRNEKVEDNNTEAAEKLLVSEFEWDEDGVICYIAAPIHEGFIVPIHLNELLDASFIFKNGYFKFQAKVIDRLAKDNVALLKIERISDIQRIQRRQFFRLEYNLPVKYRIVDSTEVEDDIEEKYRYGMSEDLSGGGISILTDEIINKNEIICCQCFLDQQNSIEFTGKVIRVSDKMKNEVKRYSIGVSFTEIEEKYRDILIKFIFKKQRKLRKKGLI